jgi:hypothetical protein
MKNKLNPKCKTCATEECTDCKHEVALDTKPTTTRAQTKTIEHCDKLLVKVGLPSYTQVENHGAMLGVAAMESLALGKDLIKKINALESEISRWKAEYVAASELVATLYKSVTDNSDGPRLGVIEDVQATIAELKQWESEYYKAHEKAVSNERDLCALHIEFAMFKQRMKEESIDRITA